MKKMIPAIRRLMRSPSLYIFAIGYFAGLAVEHGTNVAYGGVKMRSSAEELFVVYSIFSFCALLAYFWVRWVNKNGY